MYAHWLVNSWSHGVKQWNCSPPSAMKAGTHEGACSRSTLLQHAPGAKLPRLHQRFLAKKYVAQQNFCSWVLLHHIKLVWYERASSRGKSVTRVCFRNKPPLVHWNLLAVTWLVSSWPIKLAYFFSSHASIGLFHHSAPSLCPSCVLFGVLTWERVSEACFRSTLPCVYRPWAGNIAKTMTSKGETVYSYMYLQNVDCCCSWSERTVEGSPEPWHVFQNLFCFAI